MQPDFAAFFETYAGFYNRALAGEPVFDEIMAVFTESFLGAGPGVVNCGQNGDEFRKQLQQGYDFYRQIGTKKMSVRGLAVTPIDPLHNMVKVAWRAAYQKDGKPLAIDFEVTYLLQTRDDGPKVFAFVAGDEMATYRKYGLID